jgi:hypothetical protein
MPSFTAPISNCDKLHKVVFALAVEGPMDDPVVAPPWITANIVEDIESHISEDLAKAYDPIINEGDILGIVLVQDDLNGKISRHMFGMKVKFWPHKGVFRIGLKSLMSTFDIKLVEAQINESESATHLELRLRPCVVSTDRDDDSMEGAFV